MVMPNHHVIQGNRKAHDQCYTGCTPEGRRQQPRDHARVSSPGEYCRKTAALIVSLEYFVLKLHTGTIFIKPQKTGVRLCPANNDMGQYWEMVGQHILPMVLLYLRMQ